MKKVIFYIMLGIVGVLILLLTDCDISIQSDEIGTSEICATYWVEHRTDENIIACAILRVGHPDGDVLTLSGEDKLTCNNKEFYGDSECYHTSFDTPQNSYIFRFEREDQTIETVVHVPPSPGHVEVSPANNYNEWDTLTVNWKEYGSSDSIELVITGDEIYDYVETGIDDNGTVKVNDSELPGIQSKYNAESCPITISVRKCQVSVLGNPYKFGSTATGKRCSGDVIINKFHPKYTLAIEIDPAYKGSVIPVGGISGVPEELDLDEPQVDNMYYKYENEKITLIPIPRKGYVFDHWTGDISGSDNPATITIDSNMSITAYFKLD